MSLACKLDQPDAPLWGTGFHLSVPFGEGAGVALVEPDSQRVMAMLHSSDVLVGVFAVAGDTARILWTRASSARAPLLGVVIQSDGHLLTIQVDRPFGNPATRPLKLFDTATDTIWPGHCSQVA
jgi:hypothetical protein